MVNTLFPSQHTSVNIQLQSQDTTSVSTHIFTTNAQLHGQHIISDT